MSNTIDIELIEKFQKYTVASLLIILCTLNEYRQGRYGMTQYSAWQYIVTSSYNIYVYTIQRILHDSIISISRALLLIFFIIVYQYVVLEMFTY